MATNNNDTCPDADCKHPVGHHFNEADGSDLWCQTCDNGVRCLPFKNPAPEPRGDASPIDMILHCPKCGTQHVDKAEPDVCQDCGLDVDAHDAVECTFVAWLNPPHKSHRCGNCNIVWRPADVPTNGVAKIKTAGDNDTKDFGINPNEQSNQPAADLTEAAMAYLTHVVWSGFVGEIRERVLSAQTSKSIASNWMADFAQQAVQDALKRQLPEGMENCTIQFKKCELGHGWLTATNWEQHGCPTCAVAAREREIALHVERLFTECGLIADGAVAVREYFQRQL